MISFSKPNCCIYVLKVWRVEIHVKECLLNEFNFAFLFVFNYFIYDLWCNHWWVERYHISEYNKLLLLSYLIILIQMLRIISFFPTFLFSFIKYILTKTRYTYFNILSLFGFFIRSNEKVLTSVAVFNLTWLTISKLVEVLNCFVTRWAKVINAH